MQQDQLIEKTNVYLAGNENEPIVQVAKLAEQILDDICNSIQPGMSESQATAKAQQIFKDHSIEKLWHRPLIRFNEHTLCTFKDRPTADLILKDNDIAFVDIGIVKDGIEGDVGRTIVFGDNAHFHHLKTVSEIIFQDAIEYWQNNNPTGIALYEYIHTQAENHEVAFNLSPAGHLIGAFPHTHAWTKGANTYPETLAAKGWILEIQIKSLQLPYGAFYEGLLIENK